MFFEYIEIKEPNLEISIKLSLTNSYSIDLYYLSSLAFVLTKL